ncbi:hypothetical protein LP420_10175 [Massilia sp. B-10]|nr:hypothetical protein LP420_10175 [Massilia sp. B-10]
MVFFIGSGDALCVAKEEPGRTHGWSRSDLSSAQISRDFPWGASCKRFQRGPGRGGRDRPGHGAVGRQRRPSVPEPGQFGCRHRLERRSELACLSLQSRLPARRPIPCRSPACSSATLRRPLRDRGRHRGQPG